MGRRGRGEALDQSHCREWVSMGPHDTSQLGFLLIFNPRAESFTKQSTMWLTRALWGAAYNTIPQTKVLAGSSQERG